MQPLSWEASYATTDRWEDEGSEESKKGIKKFLKDYMKKMEKLAIQAERTEADNTALV